MPTYIDVDEALRRLRGNKKLYVKMLQLFLDGSEFANFEAAVADQKLSEAADILHAIKGIAGNLSLTALFELSVPIMRQLRAGEMDAARIEEYREIYAATCEHILKEIEQL